MTIGDMASRLIRARESRTAIPPFTVEAKDFSLDEAYRVQAALLDRAIGKGEILCGYKMGLTSRSKQEDVKVYEPIRGFLLKSFQVANGARVATESRIHPRVEPEIAVVLSRRLAGEVSVPEVRASLAWVGPAVEILDSRYENFSFTLPDVVADNTSASGFMLGSQNWLPQVSEIPLFGISVRKNGIIVETGAPAAVLGDPLNSVVELARKVPLEPGMVVLTGGITASVTLAKGDVVEFVWPTETMNVSAH